MMTLLQPGLQSRACVVQLSDESLDSVMLEFYLKSDFSPEQLEISLHCRPSRAGLKFILRSQTEA